MLFEGGLYEGYPLPPLLRCDLMLFEGGLY